MKSDESPAPTASGSHSSTFAVRASRLRRLTASVSASALQKTHQPLWGSAWQFHEQSGLFDRAWRQSAIFLLVFTATPEDTDWLLKATDR